MSYDTLRQTPGRKPCVLVKLELTSGTQWLCTARDGAPLQISGERVRPLIEIDGVSLAPSRIDYGRGIGYIGRCTIRVNDEFESSGTYFGKLLAADPFWLNKKCTVYEGYLSDSGFSLSDFSARVFYLDQIDGPDSKGNVTITARDPLSFVSDDKAVYPTPDTLTLVAEMAADATSFYADESLMTGWSAPGYVCIGSEIVFFGSINSGGEFTDLRRGEFGTTAASHSPRDVLQRVGVFYNTPDVIIQTLLEDYGGIPAAMIDSSQILAEILKWYGTRALRRYVAKPTKVRDLLNELCEQLRSHMYYDERDQQIRLQVIAPPIGVSSLTIDETNNILMGSQNIVRDPKNICTRVLVNYGQINPLAGTSDGNFRYGYEIIDTVMEDADHRDRVMYRIVNATWLGENDGDLAAALAARSLKMYGHERRTLKFDLDSGDSTDLWIGDQVYIKSRCLQDSSGTQNPVLCRILEVEERQGSRRKYLAIDESDIFPGRYFLIAPNGTPDYTSATAEQKSKYFFICDTTTKKMSNGDDPYLIL